jgi:hypothetical protein
MSLIDCKVEFGLSVIGFAAGNFVLDSASLGILGTSELSGLEWYDVSSFVQGVQVSRGRSRQLDYYQGGTATIFFKNADRRFDPLNTSSPYYPTIKPRNLVRISSRGKYLFTGFVTDWDFEYDIANQDIGTANCADAFSVLANQVLSASTPSTESTGIRVNTVLNFSEVDFRGGRNISDGLSTLGSFAISADTNVLNYLRQVERSELGSLFIAANGNIVFRERSEFPGNAIVSFADDGTGISYQSLINQFGDELLFNYIRAQSPAGAEQIASDTASINEFQISQLVWSDLLNSSTTEVSNISKVLLTQYKDPKVRFTGLSLQLLGLSETEQDPILNLDLTDFINVKKTFATGAPSSITEFSLITGIKHDIRPSSHVVTFAIENRKNTTGLILGDSSFGLLDSDVLYF